MNMFNWQAVQGESVVTSRFWIYWAVTIPFTFIILGIWLAWLRRHAHAENEPIADQIAAISGANASQDNIIHDESDCAKPTTLWSRITGSGSKAKLESEEDGADSSKLQESGSDMAKTTSASPLERPEAIVRKRNTLIQGPRR
jgi:hypothetical protein